MTKSKVFLIAAIVFVNVGFTFHFFAAPPPPAPAPKTDNAASSPSATPSPAKTIDVLMAGEWRIVNMARRTFIRTFYENGTFTTAEPMSAEKGVWSMDDGKLKMIFADGRAEAFVLPLNPKGTAAVDQAGSPMIAYLDRYAATSGSHASPLTPAPEAEDPPATPPGGPGDAATIELLSAGPWKIWGVNWSAMRIFRRNGTFMSQTNAREHGRWTINNGRIEMQYIDGHVDALTLPLNPKGTLGMGSDGLGTMACLTVNMEGTAVTPATSSAAAGAPKIDLDLPADSTLGDVIALLQKKYPDCGFIIASAKLKGVKMGEIKLREATLTQLASALNTASSGGVIATTDSGKNLYLRLPAWTGRPVTVVDQHTKIDLDLPANGTLGDLIALLKAKYPDFGVNSSSDKLNAVKIGELKLRDASLMELAMILNKAGRGQFSATAEGGNNLFLREQNTGPAAVGQGGIIDLDLPAGSNVGDLIAVLKKKYPGFGVNILSDNLKDVRIGEIKLRGASLEQLAGILNSAGRGRLIATAEGGNNLVLREVRATNIY